MKTLTPYKIRQNGFTLVEMAIVIVIIGLLLTTALGFATSLRQSSALSATLTREQAIKNALISFIAQNNRLPCPAPSTLPLPPTPAPIPGVEDTPGNSPATACPNSNPTNSNTVGVKVVTGIVPWVSLGLTDDAGTDGYYNRFTYQVVQSATYNNLTSQTVSGIKGDISVHLTTPAMPAATQGPAPTGNQVNYCIPTGSTSTYNSCAAVAIIVSHGSNGTGGYTRSGVATPAPVGSDEQENSDFNAKFVMKDASNSATNPFDDIVLPLNANDLISPLTLNGSLQSANAVIANDFANITASIIANATLTKQPPSTAVSTRTFNNTGAFNYCSTSSNFYSLSPVPMPKDPWGSIINYAAGTYSNICTATALMNTTTSTPNIAFTLQSYGPDMLANTSDDIIVNIPVGQVMGPFGANGW